MNFKIVKKLKGAARMGRAGILKTPHGVIETPAFVTVGTQAAVKALTIEQVRSLGAQVVLGNTYHLYLEPGPELVKKAGGLGKFMGWDGPTMTDSGGFQVFSLGAAYGKKVGKIKTSPPAPSPKFPILERGIKGVREELNKLVQIDEDGVTFRSHLDGSRHRFTPERSIQIQRQLGADIIFAFDECTSPEASKNYQKKALERTHRWAERSLAEHKRLSTTPPSAPLLNQGGEGGGNSLAIFGIVQGGRHKDLRERSARALARMDFDGFGIGGSFDKKDINTAVGWVNKILPENKPRHLLGIGEPEDLFDAVEKGCDLFDCVSPTRLGRHGVVYTARGKMNILKEKFRRDFSPIEKNCGCIYSRAYLAHLFRARESLAGTLASIHNLYFIVNLVKNIRRSILNGNFSRFKADFLREYRN